MEIVGLIFGSIAGCLAAREVAERVWRGDRPLHVGLMVIGTGIGAAAGMFGGWYIS